MKLKLLPQAVLKLLKRQEAIDNLAKYAKANNQKETAKRIQKMSLEVFDQALEEALK